MTTRDDDLDGELLGSLMQTLAPERPPSGLLDVLLKATETTSRFERFVARVGQLCDLPLQGADALVRSIDDAAKWITGPAGGVELFHIDAGPKLAGAVCGFVRIAPGSTFPAHAHAGDEVMLVLAGGLVIESGHEKGRTVRAGDELATKSGEEHLLRALPGPDLLYLVVVDKGIVFEGETEIAGPDDPRT
jgi:quercetin dioxygenase-like cupin family protein